jgi:iron(III) transport system substrate-binding protein
LELFQRIDLSSEINLTGSRPIDQVRARPEATLARRGIVTATGGPAMKSLLNSCALVVLGALGIAGAQANEVNIYTYRETKLIQPLFEAFTKDTGVKVNVISASSGLEQRIKTEGANSPADVLLTVDIGRLEEAVDLGITQAVKSDVLDKTVPAQYRDPEGHWYGMAMRARVVYASKDRVKQTTLTYEELADQKWKGKICIRSGQHIYNIALFAAMIVKHGEPAAEQWLRGVKSNLAQKPAGGDRETARDVAAGTCDLGIGNTYYWALMNDKETDKKPWADATKVILPTFQGGGTHVNISGVVLAKHAPNKANGIKFMEWMVGEKAQQMHAEMTYEYPARAGVAINKTIAGYGPLQADPMPLSQIAANRKKASAMVDKVGFNN